MLVPILLFILGLLCLIKGGDWFVDGASALAHKFNLPEILIGATVVSIGTTLPEVMVSATSAATGHGELAYGNAIGSIICNTALIAALTLTIKPAEIEKKSLKLPSAVFFVAAAVYMIVSYFTKSFSRLVGCILLLMFIAYIIISVKQGMKTMTCKTFEAAAGAGLEAVGDIHLETVTGADQEKADEKKEKELSTPKMILALVIGAALIAVGARLLVDNGTLIAEGLGVPESVIALTFVALGTSLPELVTAITSLVKGHGALSIGNIIGANLFNLVLVSGLSITIQPFDLPSSKLIGGLNASLLVDLPLMVLVSVIMILPAIIKGKMYRWQGVLLLLLYAGYVVFQFS